jgi:hypothetical protein
MVSNIQPLDCEPNMLSLCAFIIASLWERVHVAFGLHGVLDGYCHNNRQPM